MLCLSLPAGFDISRAVLLLAPRKQLYKLMILYGVPQNITCRVSQWPLPNIPLLAS